MDKKTTQSNQNKQLKPADGKPKRAVPSRRTLEMIMKLARNYQRIPEMPEGLSGVIMS